MGLGMINGTELKNGITLWWTNIAIENGPIEIVDFPIENGGSFHSYVTNYQRVMTD